MPAAFAEMVTGCSSDMRPCSSASSVSRMVITLVTDATGRALSAFISNRICPLSASISSAAAQFS